MHEPVSLIQGDGRRPWEASGKQGFAVLSARPRTARKGEGVRCPPPGSLARFWSVASGARTRATRPPRRVRSGSGCCPENAGSLPGSSRDEASQGGLAGPVPGSGQCGQGRRETCARLSVRPGAEPDATLRRPRRQLQGGGASGVQARSQWAASGDVGAQAVQRRPNRGGARGAEGGTIGAVTDARKAYTAGNEGIHISLNRRFRVAQKLLWTSSSSFLGDPIIPKIRCATGPWSLRNPLRTLPLSSDMEGPLGLRSETNRVGWLRNETTVGREHER